MPDQTTRNAPPMPTPKRGYESPRLERHPYTLITGASLPIKTTLPTPPNHPR